MFGVEVILYAESSHVIVLKMSPSTVRNNFGTKYAKPISTPGCKMSNRRDKINCMLSFLS